ncbi:SRPBCC family protein [Micromonospora sp. WMMD1102]|uniref:SRPBCC family protein n=1 Tax=Micromonospora sp. WMMD1102 TaxID=3016105 RepID=UPI0024154696|nr:SRPBCC family protein [Micromonospora sp. WMMD1102]MDG4787399.1 SRPBCC family protein [Micromonospora sp. WMMD1102]
MNESLETADGRQVLRIERRLPHPPEKVWPAVTEPGHLREWFPAEVRLDPRVGGRMTFSFGSAAEDAPESVGRVDAYDPPRLFAFSWEEELFRIELHPDGPGCLLVFSHVFDDRAGAASFASGWQICLDTLDGLLDGRATDHSPRPSARLHESYVERFGLADGVVETTDDGWRVRFERQLTRPAEAVWAALGGTTPQDGTGTLGGPPPAGFTSAEFPAGPVTALDAPSLLEYAWEAAGAPAGRIRWQLAEGTGHGARLLLEQTGPAGTAGDGATALTAWRARIEPLARQLAEEADRRP